jgi:hypothetical protein
VAREAGSTIAVEFIVPGVGFGRRPYSLARADAANQIVSAGWSRCRTLLCSSRMARWLRPEAGNLERAATTTRRRLSTTVPNKKPGHG